MMRTGFVFGELKSMQKQGYAQDSPSIVMGLARTEKFDGSQKT
jgi:hypothetical protein